MYKQLDLWEIPKNPQWTWELNGIIPWKWNEHCLYGKWTIIKIIKK